MLLLLFSPTKTLSERFHIVANCRERGPSPDFLKKFPQLGELIGQMVAARPALRPSIEEIKTHPLFSSRPLTRRVNLDWRRQGLGTLLQSKKVILQIGDTGKPKWKYVKLAESALFVYDHKDATKAKLRYPLAECQIEALPESSSTSEGSLRRTQSMLTFEGPNYPHYTHKVEHPQLETLYLDVPQKPSGVIAF